MSGWGVIRGFDTGLKCWRCLEVPVPDEDELGLCDWCITSLQDSPRRAERVGKARASAAAASQVVIMRMPPAIT